MARIYGLRTSSNFADIADNAKAITNLGLRVADFVAIAGITATGVKSSDFRALTGLTADIGDQLASLETVASGLASGLANKASLYGGTIGPVLISGILYTDRPIVSTISGGRLYGAASGSFLSPYLPSPPLLQGESPSFWIRPQALGNINDLMTIQYSFNGSAAYTSGPARFGQLTVTSGLGNYQGKTLPVVSGYENYKLYQQITNASGVTYAVRTQLPPPTAFSGCCIWLDSEKSLFTISGGRVVQWSSALAGGPSASQSVPSIAPLYSVSGLVDSGITKPTVDFTGSEATSLGSIGGNFIDAATILVMTQVRNSDYCILGNTTSNQGRWRTVSGYGNWPLLSSGVIPRFPAAMPANGTILFSIRASQSYGIEVRGNSERIDYVAGSGFTYRADGEYLIGTAPGSAGRFSGRLMTIIGFNRILPDQELRTVEEYCLWRYNSVYNPEKSQLIQLEDDNLASGNTLELEDGSVLEAS
jgi:hypothetical protein